MYDGRLVHKVDDHAPTVTLGYWGHNPQDFATNKKDLFTLQEAAHLMYSSKLYRHNVSCPSQVSIDLHIFPVFKDVYLKARIHKSAFT